MIDCLGKTYWIPHEGHTDPNEFGISSWYGGLQAALREYAIEVYANNKTEYAVVPKFRLKMRTKHHDFGHCDKCNEIAAERTDIRRNRLGAAALAANAEKARAHAAMYMGERRALEALRLSAGRGDILFCMRDKCGDDCLYLPSRPRQTLGNKGNYQWRMAAQFELYPGKLTQINLLPANVIAGSNFGCSSCCSGLCSLIDRGIMTPSTRVLIMNEDGGSENVNWVHHALSMTLIKEVAILDDLYVPRLPPEHHHDWADTTISVVEGALDAPGFDGVDTLPDMQHFLRQLFTNSKAYGQTAVVVNMQLANHNWSAWFDGHVDANFGRIGKPHVWRYSRHPETGMPVAHYKMLIQDKATFYQDEWGPWNEVYVRRTNEHGVMERDVRVLRTDPNGVPFMLSYPDISQDPGLEAWKEDEEWSRATVFDSVIRKWKYSKQKLSTATSSHPPTDSWQALSNFYASHQTSDTLPPMPVRLATPAGETVDLAGYPLEGGWHAMWCKLKQFNAPTPTTGASSATNGSAIIPAAPIANGASSSSAPYLVGTAVHGSNPPRASEVNVVNTSSYNDAKRKRAAAAEKLNKSQLWDYVTNVFATSLRLCWVAIVNFEGELRVGLGEVTLSDNMGDIERSDDVDITVKWFQRKAFKPGSTDKKTGVEVGFLWGVQPAFEWAISGYTAQRKPIQEISTAKFDDLLPIAVTVYSSSSNTEPKPEQRCVAALLAYCKAHTSGGPSLWRSVADAQQERQVSALCGPAAASSDEEDGGESEDAQEEESEEGEEDGGESEEAQEEESEEGEEEDSMEESAPAAPPPPLCAVADRSARASTRASKRT